MRHGRLVFLCACMLGFASLPFSSPAFAQKKKIVMTDFSASPDGKDSDKLPKGWVLTVWRGKPDFRLMPDEGRGAAALRMRSDKASFSIHREVMLDLRKFPNLSWRWKVTKLPEGADARNGASDDQAAGVYVLFHKFPGFLNSRLIGYVWETSAPAGAVLKSRKNPKVHYIVVRSGAGDLDRWITEKRNVLDDYRRVFGSEPPRVGGLALMIDTDDTLSSAESYFRQGGIQGARLRRRRSPPVWPARQSSGFPRLGLRIKDLARLFSLSWPRRPFAEDAWRGFFIS